MSDIKVEIRGDGSGAKQAFHEGGEGAHNFGEHIGEAVEKVHLFVETIEKSLEKVIEFGKESVEAYFKLEKANMQLERAAGDSTEAFKEQAAAMSEHLGVSNVTVETMQKMLVTFGEAPDQVEATTKALIDYAAYSGTDAVSATHALLSATQSGKAAFKELGLEYEKTGHASSTLTNITAALAAKIGGTAEEESNTLEGTLKKAEAQTTLLKQSVGQMIAELVADTGAVGTFTGLIKDMQQALRIETGHGRGIAELGVELERANATLERYKIGWFYSTEDVQKQTKEVERLQAAIVQAGLAQMNRGIHGEDKLASTNANDHSVKGERIKKERENERTFTEKEDAADLQMLLDYENAKKEHEAKYWDDVIKLQQDGAKKTMEEQDKAAKAEQDAYAADLAAGAEIVRKELEKEAHNTLATQRKLAEDMKKQSELLKHELGQAGAAIGNALISAIAQAIDQGMAGEQLDIEATLIDLGFSAAGIAAGAIATYYGGPAAGQLAAGAISGIGMIAHNEHASGVKRAKAAAAHHDGGWVEPESYHSGGFLGVGTDESMIRAQVGEAVLSRNDVRRMGGKTGVDSARRGGGGQPLAFHVQTMDSHSFREFLEDRGGRGFYNTLRTGRGQLSTLFGSR